MSTAARPNRAAVTSHGRDRREYAKLSMLNRDAGNVGERAPRRCRASIHPIKVATDSATRTTFATLGVCGVYPIIPTTIRPQMPEPAANLRFHVSQPLGATRRFPDGCSSNASRARRRIIGHLAFGEDAANGIPSNMGNPLAS